MTKNRNLFPLFAGLFLMLRRAFNIVQTYDTVKYFAHIIAIQRECLIQLC